MRLCWRECYARDCLETLVGSLWKVFAELL